MHLFMQLFLDLLQDGEDQRRLNHVVMVHMMLYTIQTWKGLARLMFLMVENQCLEGKELCKVSCAKAILVNIIYYAASFQHFSNKSLSDAINYYC